MAAALTDDEKLIREQFSKIQNPTLKKDLIENISVFFLKSKSSKTTLIKYNNDFKPLVSKIAGKNSLVIKKDSAGHEILEIGIGAELLKLQSTGRKDNSLAGKQLADLTEKGTLLSLYHSLDEVKEFINDSKIFEAWRNTFVETPKVVKKLVGSTSSFNCIHDATGQIYDGKKFSPDGGFCDLISKISKFEFSSKDAYNPADIWLVKPAEFARILKTIENISKNPETAIDQCNGLILAEYNAKNLYGISLKKMDSTGRYELHKNGDIPFYNIKPGKFKINLSPDVGACIEGQYHYKNVETGKEIKFKNRASTMGYVTTQTEFESDGTPSAARVGKCPTIIIDKIMADYHFERIKSISGYFGGSKSGPFFTKVNDSMLKEWYNMYKYCAAKPYITDEYKIKDVDVLKNIVNKAKNNPEQAGRICVKIQGLFIMYFLCKNDKDISNILTRMLNAAKKISDRNSFFIKVY